MAPRNQSLEVLNALKRENPQTIVTEQTDCSEILCNEQILHIRAAIQDLTTRFVVLSRTPGNFVSAEETPEKVQTDFYPVLLDDEIQPYSFQSVQLRNGEAILTGQAIRYTPPDRFVVPATEKYDDYNNELLV